MDIKQVDFEIINPIVTKARPRARVVNGKYAHIYTPKSTANYENLIKITYQEKAKVYFEDHPLKVRISAYFACPELLKKYQEYELKCVNHKDLDNIAKTILDALNGIAYKDDKQVCELNITKDYSTKGYDYVKVQIEQLYGSLEESKYYYKNTNLRKKIEALQNKINLTNKEKEQLEKYEKQFKELESDILNYLPF